MEVVLVITGDNGERLIKTPKKLPAALPAVQDEWVHADWSFFVVGRLWSESLDKLTICLRPPEGERRHWRRMAAHLAEAGWSYFD